MVLKPKYTADRIMESLKKPKTIYEIHTALGSSRRTVWNVLMILLKTGKVKRINRSNPNKPIYEYYLSDGVKIEEKKTFKRSLRSLGREL